MLAAITATLAGAAKKATKTAVKAAVKTAAVKGKKGKLPPPPEPLFDQLIERFDELDKDTLAIAVAAVCFILFLLIFCRSMRGKRVLLRVDISPAAGGLALPAIKHCFASGARSVTLVSHHGRPEGRDDKYSLHPAALTLAEALKRPVTFLRDCQGTDVERVCHKPPRGSITLLENMSFETNDLKKFKTDAGQQVAQAAFRASLSNLADVFVKWEGGAAKKVGIDEIASRSVE